MKWGFGTYKYYCYIEQDYKETYGNLYIAEELNPFEFYPDFTSMNKRELESWIKDKNEWENKHEYVVVQKSWANGKELVKVFDKRQEAIDYCNKLNKQERGNDCVYYWKENPKQ